MLDPEVHNTKILTLEMKTRIVYWIPLDIGYPCILDIPVYWIPLYIGYPCILDIPVYWIPLYIGYLCILDTPVYWIPLIMITKSLYPLSTLDILLKPLFWISRLSLSSLIYCGPTFLNFSTIQFLQSISDRLQFRQFSGY